MNGRGRRQRPQPRANDHQRRREGRRNLDQRSVHCAEVSNQALRRSEGPDWAQEPPSLLAGGCSGDGASRRQRPALGKPLVPLGNDEPRSAMPQESDGLRRDLDAPTRGTTAQAEDAYEVLLQTVGDAVLIADLDSDRFLRCNAAAVELLGYAPGDLSLMTLASLLPQGNGDVFEALGSELRAKGSAHRSEAMLQRRDGSCFWAEIRTRVHQGRAARHYVSIVRDVTHRVDSDRELRRAHAELEAAHAHMMHNNKLVALGQIAAGVAHELNNPASYVLMNLDEIAELLERGQAAHKALRSSLLAWLDGEQRERAEECLSGFPAHRLFRDGRELLAECVDGVQRMTSLVKDLRGFARIDESDVSLVALNDVVITACKMVGSHLRQRALLRTELDSRRQIAADRRRLVQVVTNLLMNAGQALEDEAPERHLIEVTTFDTEDSAIVRVRDTGPGIPPDLLNKIFEPFFTTKRERGTGLGLSLCSDIVRQHCGTVLALSEPGQGATFEVRLPFDTGLQPAGPIATAEPKVMGGPAGRVLIIDDEPQLVRAYRRVIARHHDVTVATGGAAGLAIIEKDPDFDAVLCDLTMPDVDGVRFYRSLDRIAPQLKGRVIFSSGGAFTRQAEELLSSIDNPLLEKPVESSRLLAAIERVRCRPPTPP
jgi:two-component system, cell cycle sensor histidine kinase and response regulator CckA